MHTAPTAPPSDAARPAVDWASSGAFSRRLLRFVDGRGLVLALLAVGVLSIPVFLARFPNDMDFYTLVSTKLLRGALLYRDALDTKPPLIFVHYALILGLAGTGRVWAVKLVTMCVLAVSARLMLTLRRELFPASGHADLSALMFVIASFSGTGEEFLSSNTELLANVFVLAAAVLMVTDDFRYRPWRLVGAGLFAGIACLYRYQSGAVLLAYAGAIMVTGKRGDRTARRCLLLGFGALVPAIAFVGYYASRQELSALQWMVRYQSSYLLRHATYWPQVWVQVGVVVVSLGPTLVLAAAQAARWRERRPLTRQQVFVLLLATISLVPFFLGGHYFPHYVVQAIPPLVLLSTEYLVSAGRTPERSASLSRHAPALLLGLVAVFTGVNAVFYGLYADPVDVPELRRFVNDHSDPQDSALLWSPRIQVLLQVDRPYATRFLTNEFLTGRIFVTPNRLRHATPESTRSAAVQELWPLLMADLSHDRPRLIIDDAPGVSNFTLEHYAALAALVHEHYGPPQVVDGYTVYVRTDTSRASP